MNSATDKAGIAQRLTRSREFLLLYGFTLISCIPLVRLLYKITFQTTNCLCMDYYIFVPAVAKLASLEISAESLRDFFQSCYLGQHFCLVQVSIHFLSAVLTNWNAQSELIFGTILGVLRAELLARICCEPRQKRKHLLFFSIAMLFIFGTSNTSNFINGQPAISTGAICLGYFWAVLVAVSPKNTTSRKVYSIVSICAVALLGNYLLGLFLLSLLIVHLNDKKTLDVGLYFVSSLAAISLALLILYFRPGCADLVEPLAIRPFVFLSILGRTFVDDLGTNFSATPASCIYSSLLLLFLIIFNFSLRSKLGRREYLGTLLTLLFGIFMAVFISIGRSSIAPWYSTFSQHAWIAMVYFCVHAIKNQEIQRNHNILRVFAYINIATVAALYLFTNCSFKNKDWYENVHSPLSSSVLRTFNTAPTYGENFVNCAAKTGWPYLSKLGREQLENHWSIFGQNQVWFLQGDYCLACVEEFPSPSGLRPRWTSGSAPNNSCSLSDPRRLNLWMPYGSRILWHVELNGNSNEGTLKFRLLQQEKPGSDEGTLEIAILSNNGKILESHSKTTNNSFELLLTKYRNQQITISLLPRAKHKNQESSGICIEQPRVLMSNYAFPKYSDSYKPSNKNCVLSFPVVKTIPFNCEKWNVSCKKYRVSEKGLRLLTGTNHDCLEYKEGLALKLPQISDIGITLEAEDNGRTPLTEVFFQFTTNHGRIIPFLLPIPISNEIQTYSFKTRLLSFEENESIVGMKIFPSFHENRMVITMKEIWFAGFDAKSPP